MAKLNLKPIFEVNKRLLWDRFKAEQSVQLNSFSNKGKISNSVERDRLKSALGQFLDEQLDSILSDFKRITSDASNWKALSSCESFLKLYNEYLSEIISKFLSEIRSYTANFDEIEFNFL